MFCERFSSATAQQDYKFFEWNKLLFILVYFSVKLDAYNGFLHKEAIGMQAFSDNTVLYMAFYLYFFSK